LPVFRGGAGRGREGTGLEAGQQGGELFAEAAELHRDQPEHRQVGEAPEATGANRPQHHLDDAGEEFGQGLGRVSFTVTNLRQKC
jgi:hypothetical protein